MESNCGKIDLLSVTDVVDNAVGLPKSQWYVAIVAHNSEKLVEKKLKDAGYNAFVAAQPEIRVWRNGRRKKVDRIIIPCRIFIRCTERQRIEIVRLPYIFRFMTDAAARKDDSLSNPPAVIPDRQMEMLMFMLHKAETPVGFYTDFRKGDAVRVVRGSLRGLEGEIIDAGNGETLLIATLHLLGSAKVSINPSDVMRISPTAQ